MEYHNKMVSMMLILHMIDVQHHNYTKHCYLCKSHAILCSVKMFFLLTLKELLLKNNINITLCSFRFLTCNLHYIYS